MQRDSSTVLLIYTLLHQDDEKLLWLRRNSFFKLGCPIMSSTLNEMCSGQNIRHTSQRNTIQFNSTTNCTLQNDPSIWISLLTNRTLYPSSSFIAGMFYWTGLFSARWTRCSGNWLFNVETKTEDLSTGENCNIPNRFQVSGTWMWETFVKHVEKPSAVWRL